LSAEEWREEMIATEKPETTEWLRNLNSGDVARAHRFYLAAKECAATLCEKAEAWREEAVSAIQDPEATDWLRNLSREELIEEYQLDREREQRIEACVVSGKFYNPFVYRPALAWRDAQISSFKEDPSPGAAENLHWLESLSGDDLIWAHKLFLAVKEKQALYQKAEEWRDDMLSADLPQNEWLKSLAEMDSEQLAKEYQSFVELWGAPEKEIEGETPEAEVASPDPQQDLHIAWYAELETLREHLEQAMDRQEEHEKRGEQEAADLVERDEVEAIAEKVYALESRILQTPTQTAQGMRLRVQLAIEAATFLSHGWSEGSYERACCEVLVNAAEKLLTLTPETAEEQE
jgi:hypothetical protein